MSRKQPKQPRANRSRLGPKALWVLGKLLSVPRARLAAHGDTRIGIHHLSMLGLDGTHPDRDTHLPKRLLYALLDKGLIAPESEWDGGGSMGIRQDGKCALLVRSYGIRYALTPRGRETYRACTSRSDTQ